MASSNSSEHEELSMQEKMDENKALLFDTITPEKVMEIANVLYTKAREGDVQAIHLWLAYAAGEPDKRMHLESEMEIPEAQEESGSWEDEPWRESLEED